MTIRMIIVLVISLFTTRIILQILGVTDYGVYNVVSGFVILFSFFNSTLSSSVQRFFNVELVKNGEIGAQIIYCASLKIHLIFGVILIVVTEVVGLWYIPNKMVLPPNQINDALWLFQFSILTLFLGIINTPFIAAIMAHERMGFYAILEISNTILKLILIIVLPVLPFNNLIGYGIINLLIVFITFLCYFIYCKNNFKEIRLGIKVPSKTFKDLLSFSGWGVLTALGHSLREQGVNLTLNFFFGPIVNAARGITNQINVALTGFTSNLYIPSRPQIFKYYSIGDLDKAWSLVYSLSKMMFFIFVLLSLPICFNIDFILKLWLGKDIPKYTQIFTILMMATNLIGTWVSPISTIMHATGKLKFYTILSSASNLLTVPLVIIFFIIFNKPQYAYWGLFLTMITNWLAGIISARKLAKLECRDYFMKVPVPCLFGLFITMLLSIWPLYFFEENFITFILISMYCILVAISVFYFFVLNKREKELLRNLLGGVISKIKIRS